MSTAFENVASVKAKRVTKVQPCHRCGTFDGVTATWSVPLEKGGSESEWNVNLLCGPCRALRKAEAGASIAAAAHRGPGSSRGRYSTKHYYIVEGRAFHGLKDVAEFYGVSTSKVSRWLATGRMGARRVER